MSARPRMDLAGLGLGRQVTRYLSSSISYGSWCGCCSAYASCSPCSSCSERLGVCWVSCMSTTHYYWVAAPSLSLHPRLSPALSLASVSPNLHIIALLAAPSHALCEIHPFAACRRLLERCPTNSPHSFLPCPERARPFCQSLGSHKHPSCVVCEQVSRVKYLPNQSFELYRPMA